MSFIDDFSYDDTRKYYILQSEIDLVPLSIFNKKDLEEHFKLNYGVNIFSYNCINKRFLKSKKLDIKEMEFPEFQYTINLLIEQISVICIKSNQYFLQDLQSKLNVYQNFEKELNRERA